MIHNLIKKLDTPLKKIIASLIVIIGAIFGGSQADVLGNAVIPSKDFTGGQWYVFDKFTGYQTKLDPSKIDDGANPQGQNTSVNDGDKISVRKLGYTLFPTTETYAESGDYVHSTHTFRKRDGINILMRATGAQMQIYDTVTDTWVKLEEGYATSTEFGFADYNINTDLHSYVYFGNGVQNFSRWSGDITHINGAVTTGADRITVDSIDGFTDTGTLVYCSTTQAYTYRSATTTSFDVTGGATECEDGETIMQSVTTDSTNPKGNIYMVQNNRLWIAGISSTTQAVYFSKYGDAMTFTSATLITESTADAAGIWNLGEGGGAVTAMAMDEKAVYVFKRSIIYQATLDGDGKYSLEPLKAFDGRSQNVGAVNQRSTFSGGNGIIFISPDNQIFNITRVADVDYPQVVPISDVIKPTTDALFFASSTAITYRDKAYIAAKSASTVGANDVVLVYNLRTQQWDSPIIGWNVGDWAIYEDTNVEELYYGDANTPNIFLVNSTPMDYIYSITANWRSKYLDFGLPNQLKEADGVWIEGYIGANATCTVSLLLDENGYSQTYSTIFYGTETTYQYEASAYNVLGLSPFGYEMFGSNPDYSGMKKFRVYLNKDFRRVPFYIAQLEIGSNNAAANWEVTSWGILVRPYSQQEKTSLFRTFK